MDEELQTVVLQLAEGLPIPEPDGTVLTIDPDALDPADPRPRALELLIERVGWPGIDLIGLEGARASWVIALNAFTAPELMHTWAKTLELAAHQNQAERHHVAHLMDRWRVLSGKEQVYGTQFTWDDDGRLIPFASARLDTLDVRRESVGLKPLEEATADLRARATAEGWTPPGDLADRRERLDAFLRRAGWRRP